MTDPQAILSNLHKNLTMLEVRKSQYGAEPPIDLLDQIDDHRQAIALTEQVIKDEINDAHWQETLKPLVKAITKRAATSELCQVTIGDIGGDVQNSIIAGRDVVVNYSQPPSPAPVDAVTHSDVSLTKSINKDNISVGNISSTNVVIGRGAQITVTQGEAGSDVTALFVAIYQQIEARPEDRDLDKEELREIVKHIQREVAGGEGANVKKVARWLKTLGELAPDVFKTITASFNEPVMGVPPAIRQLVDRIGTESE